MHYLDRPLSILHITNDFTGSKVYKSLFSELDKLEVRQTVYTAIRDPKKIGNNDITYCCNESRTIYSNILNKHIDRLVYPLKILKIFKDIQLRVDMSAIDLIHAHTWYSDGGVAYLLSKKYKIPFIITVRNTDMNLFYKRLIYLRPYGKRILSKSKAIILPSKPYERRLANSKILRGKTNNIKDKFKLIPNGVDRFWLDNSNYELKPSTAKKINVLFVGKLNDNKQIINLIKSIIKINKSSIYEVKLHIVGSGGNEEKNVIKLARSYPNYINLHGSIYDNNKLLSIYRICDVFAMPSRHETFGLVYIEALLQGLPILYTNNEGVDGLYSQKIGEKVITHTESEISEKLLKLISNLDEYSIPSTELKRNHDWQEIALKFINIYKLHTNK